MSKTYKYFYETLVLNNGMRIVAVPMKERKSVSVGIWMHVGGRDEEARLGGVSHFLEHIVFKGTSKRTANEIKEAVEGVGGSMNAFTGEEYTCFLAKVAGRHFQSVFAVLSDMVLDASLKESDIEKERTVIMEEIKMTQDQPSQLVEELFSELLWPRHALGRPIAGTVETVGGLTQRDIQDYKNTFYRPCFITVVAAGAIDLKTLKKAVSSHFPKRSGAFTKKLELFKTAQEKPGIKIFPKSTEQTHISLGMRAFCKDHPDEYALDVLNVALGGNMSSRLFNEVREERGLAYEIGSAVRRYHETGAFLVGAGVDNHKITEALKVILKELGRVRRELLKADELKRAKEFYLGQLDLGLENSMNQMLWAGESAVSLGRLRSPEEVARGIEKVTAKDLRRVAKELFNTKSLNLAVVGPRSDKLENELSRALSL